MGADVRKGADVTVPKGVVVGIAVGKLAAAYAGAAPVNAVVIGCVIGCVIVYAEDAMDIDGIEVVNPRLDVIGNEDDMYCTCGAAVAMTGLLVTLPPV